MDVRMPGPDGFQLCERIRADSRYDRIPIIFMTSCDEDKDFVQYLHAGGSAFLSKPVTRQQLLSMLKELVDEEDKS